MAHPAQALRSPSHRISVQTIPQTVSASLTHRFPTRTLNVFFKARIFLEQGTDYITVHPVLDAISFVFHSALRLFICKACGQSCLAQGCKRHFREQHNDGAHPRDWDVDAFVDFILQNAAIEDYEAVAHPAPRGPPVQMIPEPTSGYACSLSPATCAFATPSYQLMENHVAKAMHDQDRTPHVTNSFRRDVHLQTLFSWAKQLKWFEVTPELQPQSATSHNPLNLILQTILPQRLNLGPPPIQPVQDRERTRFMAFMNWDVKFADVRGDRRKHTLLQSLLRSLDRSSEDPLLKIKPAFLSLMEKANTYFGGGSNQAFAVRKHILHGENIAQIP